MGIARRREPASLPADTPAAFDERMLKRHAVLLSYLTLRVYDDGSPRQPSSLTIFAEDGLWKGCLSDKDTDSYAFATSELFSGVLDVLEKGLQEGNLDWRKRKQPANKSPKKSGQ